MAVAEAVSGILGGLVNAGMGIYNANQDRKNRRSANRAIDRWNNDAMRAIDNAYKNNVRLSSADDVDTYQQMKANFDPSQFVYDADKFDSSNYNVEKYLNPYKDQVLKDVAGTAQHTAAGSAMGHSSGAADMINRAVADKSAELYDKAYDKMQSERNFDYGMYTDYINQQQNKLNTLQQGYLTQMGLYRDDIQFDQDTDDNYLANKLNLGNATMQAKASMV